MTMPPQHLAHRGVHVVIKAALFTIGGAFVINAFVTAYATGGTASYAIRVPVLIGLLAINAGLYFVSFALLTAKVVGPRGLLPGRSSPRPG